MKTIKLLVTVTAVVVAAIATAVERPKMSIVPVSAERAVVTIFNDNAAQFELSIHAENGDLVYYKQSEKPLSSYQKVFDFEQLAHGEYSMNLRINDTRLLSSFEMTSSGIKLEEQRLRFDPYFGFSQNKLVLSYLNFDKEKLNISIYNTEGLVYQSKIEEDFAVSAGYDVSKLAPGEYQVVLSSRDNEFNFSFTK
jgi:hypothetical protein